MESGSPTGERSSASLEARSGSPVLDPLSSRSRLRPDNSSPNSVAGAVRLDESVDVTASFAEQNRESLGSSMEMAKERLPSERGAELFPDDGVRKSEQSEAALREGSSSEQGGEPEEIVTAVTSSVHEGQQSLAETTEQDASEAMDVSQPPSSCDAAQDSSRWNHLEYFLEKPPSLMAESLKDFMCNQDNYLKGCKW